MDWLGEVAYMKDMSNSVLQASVALVDRYLKTRVVDRNKLQLLGITCLLVAAKTCASTARQVHILTVRESSWLTDSTYSYEDVVKWVAPAGVVWYVDIVSDSKFCIRFYCAFPCTFLCSFVSWTKKLTNHLHLRFLLVYVCLLGMLFINTLLLVV